jgi:16S rRNA A1518/A1519 N6-dimethyltransferase RsmA/KsgA/DIM1 with predicted DNA glycosylase/AP lyase activity
VEVHRLVAAAFAHRRKTMANSLDLSGLAARRDAERALEEIGRSARARAQELAPTDFVALGAELG